MVKRRRQRRRTLSLDWVPVVLALLVAGAMPALASHVINGTSGNDTLYGTSGTDEMYGFGGNDYMDGEGGHDKGGSGTGGLWGGTGSDEMYGGTGDDGLQGGSYSGHCDSTDSLFGQGGHDVLVAHGCAIKDYLFGGSGTDMCHMDYIDYRDSCEWWTEY